MIIIQIALYFFIIPLVLIGIGLAWVWLSTVLLQWMF